MVRPWCRKNCGRKITKPKISVLIVISTQEPTIIRCNSGGLIMSIAAAGLTAGGITTGGSGLLPLASVSIACISASASSSRPSDSNQRGDSGKFLRRYQTMSEPTPAMTNIGRQPKFGITRKTRDGGGGRTHPTTTKKKTQTKDTPN